MTPMNRVLEALKKLETKYPHTPKPTPKPTDKPADKPTYEDGAAAVIQELLKQVGPEVENEKSLILDSYFFGKADAGNVNDAIEYYNKLG
jgi:hypothetical protein